VPRERDLLTLCESYARTLPGRQDAHVFVDHSEVIGHGRSYCPNVLPPLYCRHLLYWCNQERHLIGHEHLYSMDVPRDANVRRLSSKDCRLLAGNSQTISLLAALDCCMLIGVDFSRDITEVVKNAPGHGKRPCTTVDLDAMVHSIPPHPHASGLSTVRHVMPGMKRGGKGEYEVAPRVHGVAPSDFPPLVDGACVGATNVVSDTLTPAIGELLDRLGEPVYQRQSSPTKRFKQLVEVSGSCFAYAGARPCAPIRCAAAMYDASVQHASKVLVEALNRDAVLPEEITVEDICGIESWRIAYKDAVTFAKTDARFDIWVIGRELQPSPTSAAAERAQEPTTIWVQSVGGNARFGPFNFTVCLGGQSLRDTQKRLPTALDAGSQLEGDCAVLTTAKAFRLPRDSLFAVKPGRGRDVYLLKIIVHPSTLVSPGLTQVQRRALIASGFVGAKASTKPLSAKKRGRQGGLVTSSAARSMRSSGSLLSSPRSPSPRSGNTAGEDGGDDDLCSLAFRPPATNSDSDSDAVVLHIEA
jgi:hypothetical protein